MSRIRTFIRETLASPWFWLGVAATSFVSSWRANHYAAACFGAFVIGGLVSQMIYMRITARLTAVIEVWKVSYERMKAHADEQHQTMGQVLSTLETAARIVAEREASE